MRSGHIPVFGARPLINNSVARTSSAFCGEMDCGAAVLDATASKFPSRECSGEANVGS